MTKHIRKISDEKLAEIRRLLNEGVTGKKIAKQLHVPESTVSRIKTGRTYDDAIRSYI